MRDKPISKDEVDDVTKYYSETIIVCDTHTDIIEDVSGNVEIQMYQSYYVPTPSVRSPYCTFIGLTVRSNYIEEFYSDHNLDTTTHSPISVPNLAWNYNEQIIARINFGPYINFTGDEFYAPDLSLIREIYSRRRSLIRINQNYVKEKVREYFTKCITFLSNNELVKNMVPYHLHLFLTSQCIVLKISYIRSNVNEPIDNIEELNEEMINKIYYYIDTNVQN